MEFGEKSLGMKAKMTSDEFENSYKEVELKKLISNQQKITCGMCGREIFKLDDGKTIHIEDGSFICEVYSPKITFTPYTESLRDRFAMAALTGLLASCDGPAWGVNIVPFGETCYAYADQMLESRK